MYAECMHRGSTGPRLGSATYNTPCAFCDAPTVLVADITFPPEKEYVYAVDERGRTVLFHLDLKIPGLAEALGFSV